MTLKPLPEINVIKQNNFWKADLLFIPLISNLKPKN